MPDGTKPDWKKYVRQHLNLPPLQPGSEAQIIEEIAQQLEDAYRDELAGGATEAESEERARQHISDWAQFSEEIASGEKARMPAVDRWHASAFNRSPDSHLGSFVDGLWRDFLLALRTLRRKPAFGALAIVTIALGVAATVTCFSLLYAALWAPMPYPRGQELVVVSESDAKGGVVAGAVSAANFYDWKAQSQCFSALAAYTSWAFNLTGTDQPERINGAIVSPDFFDALQILPLQGRTFRPDEDERGKSDVAIVSDRLWRRLFASADLADQTITLNGSKMTVIGIMPATFAYPTKQAEIWVPLSLAPADRQNRTGKWLSVFGRLKPGLTPERAQENMDVITERLQQMYPASNTGWNSRIVSLREMRFGSLRKPLLLLQVAVALLLIAACFNIAGLMLAHAKAREGEFETRLILGATRLRMVRQLLMESLIFAGAGGLLGVLLSCWVVALLRTELARIVPALDQIAINKAALELGVFLVAVSVLICGLIPALRSIRGSLPSRAYRGPVRSLRMRQMLVVSQVAFAVILVVGAMAIVRSFVRLVAVDPGFNPQNAVAIDLTLSKAKYATSQRQTAFLRDLLEQVRSLPSVVDAGGGE
jgi:putative ABC transport system permease protein